MNPAHAQGDREQLEKQLKDIKLERIRRMEQELMWYYKPHSAQIDFHRSKGKIRGLFGGNQSGKTLAGSIEVANIVGKVHQYRPNYIGQVMGRDCCIDFGHVTQVLVPTYQKILPRNECKLPGLTFEGKERIWPGLKGGTWEKAYHSTDKMLSLADGSFIEFKSYDQGYQRFQGAQRHVIREDEEAPKMIHDENLARQITLGMNIIITMTPLNYSQWLYVDVFQAAADDSEIEVFKMASAENPYANKEMLLSLEKNIKDEAERHARLYGDFTYLAGRIYKEYGDHNLIDHAVLPDHWERRILIDPHPEKPTAVNWVAVSPDGKHYAYREGDYKGDIRSVCQQIKSDNDNDYITTMLIDPYPAEQKSTLDGRSRRLIDAFRDHFPQLIPAKRASREYGINLVRQAVTDGPSGPTFLCMRSCPVTHHQMLNYSWKPPTASGEDRSKPEVYKKNDDHPDNIRHHLSFDMSMAKDNFSDFGVRVYGNG